jgi:hypothetical protein
MYLVFDVEIPSPTPGAIRFKGRDNRIRRAEDMAAAHDFDHWLDETESYVVPRDVQSTQGHETFVHTNIRQYLNEILIKEGQER